MNEPQPLNAQVLAKLRKAMDGSGIDLVSELIEMFLVDGPQMIAGIRAAHEEADASKLATEVHNLKGSVANLGAQRLADLCEDVETAARGDTLGEIGGGLEALYAEYERVLRALRNEAAA